MKASQYTNTYILLLTLVLGLLIHWFGCGVYFGPILTFSDNIQESKERKLFLAEYKIADVKCYPTIGVFPIKSVWKEKLSLRDKNEYGIYFNKVKDDEPIIRFNFNANDAIYPEGKYMGDLYTICTRDREEELSGGDKYILHVPIKDDTILMSIIRGRLDSIPGELVANFTLIKQK